ncbi:MAG TPA: maleylacetoacetate isomerase [Stellaceae bacterium]|nr:maleylacetoacetate isomerase [Stellaceae bacterium]
MKLYGYFRSSAAFRVRIALNLKGLPYGQHSIHLRRNEQSAPDYLKLNPQALVPTLVDGGKIVTQSLAIIDYLEETHPAPALLPQGPLERARVRSIAQMIACDIHPIDNLRVLRYLGNPLGHDEKTVEAWFNHWIKLGFDAIEQRLVGEKETGRFCHGDAPGLADCCLVPQVFNAQRHKSFDFRPYPTIMRIFDACLAVPAFDRAVPAKQPDAEAG